MKVRLFTALFTLMVIVAGIGVNALNERPAQGQIPVSMHLKQDSPVPPVMVHIHQVRPVQHLADPSGEIIPTNGVWVVVDLSYASRARATFVQSLGLIDAHGNFFENSSRTSASLWRAEQDLWNRGEVAFEVPREALGQMQLRLYVTSRHAVVPVRYGRMDITVDPSDLEPGPVLLDRPALLPGGER